MVKIKLKSGIEIYMDGMIKNALDSLIYNVTSDWDFVIVISGDRMVRVGKSVLAMQICAYLADKLDTPFGLDNIFFDSKEMIDQAQVMPKHSLIQYDEGREGLAASKSMQRVTQDLIDFFNECGQLNHIFVIVLPDFFTLKEEIAIGRSEFMINVYRSEDNILKDIYHDGEKIALVKFDRGYFSFYNRYKKQELYDKAVSTRRRNYLMVSPNFRGRFTNVYTVDEATYRLKKKESLARFKQKHDEEKLSPRMTAMQIFRQKYAFDLHEQGLTSEQISERAKNDLGFDINPSVWREDIRKYKRKVAEDDQ